MPKLFDQLEELIQVAQACKPGMDGLANAVRHFASDIVEKHCRVLSCGNGGSATDALHLAEELVGRYRSNRKALPGIALVADASALTCIANDWDYDSVFSRQIEAHGKQGDWLVSFSTSGNSPNIIKAIETANYMGMITFSLLGKDGGRAKGKSTYEFIVPSQNTARIQEIHTWILHALLEAVEAKF